MATRKNNVNDKARPGVNFVINFPIRFNVSSTSSFKEKLEEYSNRKKTTIADTSRDLLFSFFDVRNVNELLKTNKSINKSTLKLSETIKDEMGLTPREFSDWYREAFGKLE